MIIAVASDGLDVASSFTQSENFNYYHTKSCEIIDAQNMPAQSYTPEQYAQMMSELNVIALICGSISEEAIEAFNNQEIEVFPHAAGNALSAAQLFIEGKLVSSKGQVLGSCDEAFDD